MVKNGIVEATKNAWRNHEWDGVVILHPFLILYLSSGLLDCFETILNSRNLVSVVILEMFAVRIVRQLQKKFVTFANEMKDSIITWKPTNLWFINIILKAICDLNGLFIQSYRIIYKNWINLFIDSLLLGVAVIYRFYFNFIIILKYLGIDWYNFKLCLTWQWKCVMFPHCE